MNAQRLSTRLYRTLNSCHSVLKKNIETDKTLFSLRPCVCQRSSSSVIISKRPFSSTSPAIKQIDGEDFNTKSVTECIKEKLNSPLNRLFAVVLVAGKQRKVTTDDIIILDKPVEADIGERIVLNKVLLVGGSDFTFVGRPILSSNMVRVEAVVLEKTLSQTIISFWYKRRKDWRRMYLKKLTLSYLRITNIEISPQLTET